LNTRAALDSAGRDHVGIVVIGRNEGVRLARALDSVQMLGHPLVYVDSGSTDGSVGLAAARGVPTVVLSADQPFTAARGRNAGLAHLCRRTPAIEYVQFLDGDCTLAEGWLPRAGAALASSPELGVVCGHVCEAGDSTARYRALSQVEWDGIAGEVAGTGGNALVRVAAFRAAGGFDARLVAGEDTELCSRITARGWAIRRLDAAMVSHDAAMTQFGQWWARARRAGYGFAQCVWLADARGPHIFRRALLGTLLWGGLLPLGALVAGSLTNGWSLLALLAYGRVLHAAYRGGRARGAARRAALLYAAACCLAKFPQFLGVRAFCAHTLAHGAPPREPWDIEGQSGDPWSGESVSAAASSHA
jgi:GT2 family glycosyltransferase